MKYLSIDLEATGLDEDSLIIEFAAVPFDTESLEIESSSSFHTYVQCPSFHELRPQLSSWVLKHNKSLITKAHQEGKTLIEFKTELENYLTSQTIQSYFQEKQYTLFGKSLNAIDLPFLNRDLGTAFMKKYFVHRQLDLSSFVYALIDMKQLNPEMISGSELMSFLNMGQVSHTALADAINTVQMYFSLLKKCNALDISSLSKPE